MSALQRENKGLLSRLLADVGVTDRTQADVGIITDGQVQLFADVARTTVYVRPLNLSSRGYTVIPYKGFEAVYDTEIIIGRKYGRASFEFIDYDWERRAIGPRATVPAGVTQHGAQHFWSRGIGVQQTANVVRDPVMLSSAQISDLDVVPDGAIGFIVKSSVLVFPSGAITHFSGGASGDLSAQIPGTSGQVKIARVELDSAGVLYTTWGSAFTGPASERNAITNAPSPTSGRAQIALIALENGMTALGYNHITRVAHVSSNAAETALPKFGAGVIKTLSADVVAAGSDRHLIIAAQTGTTDNLIEITGLAIGDEVIIRADVGDTITVVHASGSATDKIYLYGGTSIAASGNDTLKLVKVAAGVVVQYVDKQAGAGGDAPADAKYIVTEANGTLTNEIVIPGLEADPSIAGRAGAGFAKEFDTSGDLPTWTPSAPASSDSDTTEPSHYYARSTDTTERLAYWSWSPSGAFDLRCKIALGTESAAAATTGVAGILVMDSTNANRLYNTLARRTGNLFSVEAITYTGGTGTQRGSSWNIGVNELYLRITRDGSNNVSFWFSTSGKAGTWQLIATQAFTFTVARVGLRMATGVANYSVLCDWIRADV
jgi:hypothetical protein